MVDRLNYIPYFGNTHDLTIDGDQINFRWNRPGCKILFSVAKTGNSILTHVYSDGRGKLKDALNDWVEFIFWTFDWCKMIVGAVNIPKVTKLAIEECGFELIRSKDGVDLIIRRP